MAETGVRGAIGAPRRTNGLLTAIGCCLMLAACSKTEQSLSDMLAAQTCWPAETAPSRSPAPPARPRDRSPAHDAASPDGRQGRARQGHRVLGQGLREEPARTRRPPSTTPATSRRRARSSRRSPCCSRPRAPTRPTRASPASTAACCSSSTTSRWPRSCSSRPTIPANPDWKIDLRARHRVRQAEPVQQGHAAVRAGLAAGARISPR